MRMSYYNKDNSNNDCKVYVGNLPPDIRVRDLEDVFYKYGKIVDVDLHTNTGRGDRGGGGGDRGGGDRGGGDRGGGDRMAFAYVEFEDTR